MLKLSEGDKLTLDIVTQYVMDNPGQVKTNYKLIHLMCEYFMNTANLYIMEKTRYAYCKRTKALCFPFTDRVTKEQIHICPKCEKAHSFQQVTFVVDIVTGETQ